MFNAMLVAQSRSTLRAHQAPLSMGILQARILEWVAMPSSRGSSRPRDWTQVSCTAGVLHSLLSEPPGKSESLYDPPIPLLSINLEKAALLKDTCTPKFIVALFTIARRWKQPSCLSTDEWIKMWYIIYNGYYPAIKKSEFESVLRRWMNLEPVIQSEVSQKEKKQISYIGAYIQNP